MIHIDCNFGLYDVQAQSFYLDLPSVRWNNNSEIDANVFFLRGKTKADQQLYDWEIIFEEIL